MEKHLTLRHLTCPLIVEKVGLLTGVSFVDRLFYKRVTYLMSGPKSIDMNC
jgi:hypothetical protein